MAVLGILIVHGMGAQRPTFADGLINDLDGLLRKAGVDSNAVAWQPAYWASVLNAREEALWNDLSKNNDLDQGKLRRFVLNALGDAVAYRRTDGDEGGVYDKIHDVVNHHLRALREQLGGADRPIVVIAHSLGAVIMSDYIWNEQHPGSRARGSHPLDKMETLCGMVTFGCNIPLFTLALDTVRAIEFPPTSLPDPIKAAARWYNYYDPDDILGWPLKPLSPSYDLAVSQDIAINVGGFFTSWNPASHGEYWTDNSFTHPVAELITKLVAVAPTLQPAVVAPAAPFPKAKRKRKTKS